MIYRKMMEHHLSRFYNMSHLVKEMITDTDDDKNAKTSVILVVAEWEQWCELTETLFPHRSTQNQMQRVWEQGNRGSTDSLSNISDQFDRTTELIRRLKILYGVE